MTLPPKFWAVLFTVIATVTWLNAAITVMNGLGLGEALDSTGTAVMVSMLARTFWDRAHIAKYREVRRTWRDGELQYEHRVDRDGERSTVRYPSGEVV